LDQPEVVDVLLVVANQETSAPRQPRERPLHHPPPGLVSLGAVTGLVLLADPSDVGSRLGIDRRLPTRRVVLPLVQTQVWRVLGCGLGPRHHDGLDRRPQHLAVGDVGARDGQPQQPTLGFHQHRLLGALVAAIRRVFAHIFPPEAGLTQPAVGGLPFPLHAPKFVALAWVPLGSRGPQSPGRSAAASQVDRSQHASMLYALLGVSGVTMVLLVALVFVLLSPRPRRHPRPTSNFLAISVTGIPQVIIP